MPLYSFICPAGHTELAYRKIAERDNPRECDCCSARMTRRLEAPFVQAEIPSYRSPVSGEWIDSRAQRREDLARTGSMAWEPGIREDIASRRASLTDAKLKVLDAAVEQTARDLVSSGQLPPL